MKIERRQIRCEHQGCNTLFEGPGLSYHHFRVLFMRHGWRMRGSVRGPVYFCPEHVGSNG